MYVENYTGEGIHRFSQQISNSFNVGGLFIASTTVFISNAVLNPILYTLNIGYWFKKLLQWVYKRQGKNCGLTQSEANKVFELPDFPIETTSAALINTLWFTAFYASVLPLGIVFSLLCLIYEYYVLKVYIL